MRWTALYYIHARDRRRAPPADPSQPLAKTQRIFFPSLKYRREGCQGPDPERRLARVQVPGRESNRDRVAIGVRRLVENSTLNFERGRDESRDFVDDRELERTRTRPVALLENTLDRPNRRRQVAMPERGDSRGAARPRARAREALL